MRAKALHQHFSLSPDGCSFLGRVPSCTSHSGTSTCSARRFQRLSDSFPTKASFRCLSGPRWSAQAQRHLRLRPCSPTRQRATTCPTCVSRPPSASGRMSVVARPPSTSTYIGSPRRADLESPACCRQRCCSELALVLGADSQMRNCGIAKIRLSLAIGTGASAASAKVPYAPLTEEEVGPAVRYLTKSLADTYKTWLPVIDYGVWIWVRLCAQIYLEVSDFEFAGNSLKVLCERIVKRETVRESRSLLPETTGKWMTPSKSNQ